MDLIFRDLNFYLFIYLFLYKCIPWDLQRWIVWWNTYLILQCDLVSEVYFQWGNNLTMVWGISWVIERHNLGESEVLTMCDRIWFHLNHIGGVLVLRARLEFSRSWVQASVKSSKDYKIGICCFSVRHAVYNMSTSRLFFQLASTRKIQLSVLVLYKADIIIISLNLTHSCHNIADKLFIWSNITIFVHLE